MAHTMNLLAAALKVKNVAEWTKELGLSKQALYNAKERGHLSPAIAGALADVLGQDPKDWIVVAALESERESACKDRMLKRLKKITSLYWCNFLAHLPRPSWRWMWSLIVGRLTPSISARVFWSYQPERHAFTA